MNSSSASTYKLLAENVFGRVADLILRASERFASFSLMFQSGGDTVTRERCSARLTIIGKLLPLKRVL
jgi:hypothetical protein